MKRRSRLKVATAVLAAFVMVALPLSVTLISSDTDNDDHTEPREGFAGWLDANTVEAQRVLTDVGRAMGPLEEAVASNDAGGLPAAQAESRTAILEAREFWESAPPHEAGQGIIGALDAYLTAAEGATVGEPAGAASPSTEAMITAAQDDMVAAIERVQTVAAGGT